MTPPFNWYVSPSVCTRLAKRDVECRTVAEHSRLCVRSGNHISIHDGHSTNRG